MITPTLTHQSEKKKVIGIEARTSNAAEANPAAAKIPALWQRFIQTEGSIPHKTDDHIIFGVYTKYASDYRGEYSLLVSCEVNRLEDVPEGMQAMTLAAGKYLMFVAEGGMPQALVATWGQVWEYFSGEGEHKRAYTTDYERHDMRNGSRVEVYIAVK